MRKNLTRDERLRKKKDISRVFEESESRNNYCLRILYCRNNLSWNRMAVVLRKGYGNSVKRNRAKRIVRESYRNMKNNLIAGYDIIFFLNGRITDYNSTYTTVCGLFKKTGLMNDNKDPA